MKHTPGPWYVFREEGIAGGPGRIYIAESKEDRVIAEIEMTIDVLKDGVIIPDTLLEKAGADARLIAAAPDLLAALEDLLEIERRDNLTDPDYVVGDSWREEVWNRARAVIARTKGEEDR